MSSVARGELSTCRGKWYQIVVRRIMLKLDLGTVPQMMKQLKGQNHLPVEGYIEQPQTSLASIIQLSHNIVL